MDYKINSFKQLDMSVDPVSGLIGRVLEGTKTYDALTAQPTDSNGNPLKCGMAPNPFMFRSQFKSTRFKSGTFKNMSSKELKSYVGQWDKSTFKNVSESIRYHAREHGFGDDPTKYLRRAANFNKKGATKSMPRPDGTIRYERKNGEYLIKRIDSGKVVSYGQNE